AGLLSEPVVNAPSNPNGPGAVRYEFNPPRKGLRYRRFDRTRAPPLLPLVVHHHQPKTILKKCIDTSLPDSLSAPPIPDRACARNRPTAQQGNPRTMIPRMTGIFL